MEALETGNDDVAALVPRISELDKKRRELEAKLPATETPIVELHPHAAKRYKAKVEEIQEALTRGDAAAHEAISLVRGMITKITVEPTLSSPSLVLYGELGALFRGASTGAVSSGDVGCGDRI